LARLWLLGFFTYLFLVRHRLRVAAAAVGGAVFAYAGFHLVWLDYQAHVSVSATLPVALWSLRVALDHRGDGDNPTRERAMRTFGLVGLAIALGVMVLDGHPETFVFDSILIFGYWIIALLIECPDRAARLQWARRMAGVAVLAVGISAIQLLPFIQYNGEGAHSALVATDPAGSLAGYPPDAVPLMAFPNLFGGPQLAYYDQGFYALPNPEVNYAEADGNSVGLLALCLVPVGLVAAWRRRQRTLAWFSISATAVGSLLLYTRWAGFLWHGLPIVGVSLLIRSQDIQLMGIAVLGALGVDWVLRSRADPELRKQAISIVVASFAAVNVLLIFLSQNLRRLVLLLPSSTANSRVALKIVHGNLNFEVIVAECFGLLLILVLLAPHHILRVAGAGGMVLLAFLANGGAMQSYNTTVPKSLLYPRTHAVRELTKTIGAELTLFDAGSFPVPETNLWYGISDVGSYDAIGLKWHDALYGKVFDLAGHPEEEQMPACIEGLQLFGVQWVVGGSGNWRTTLADGLPRTKTITHVPLYKVNASNEVGVVDQVIRSSGGDERALDKVSSCAFHSDYTVVLDTSPYNGSQRGTLSAPKGSTTLHDGAKITHRSTNTLTVTTTTPTGGWLVVRQSYAPGWSATVNNKPAAVVRADVAFQAVHVPPGRHTVRLSYTSSTVSDGFKLSILSSLVAIGLLLLAYSRWRQSSPLSVEKRAARARLAAARRPRH
jgi:hypothetical protein